MSHVDPDECTPIECFVLDQTEEAVKVLFTDPDGGDSEDDSEAKWIPKSLMTEESMSVVEDYVGTAESTELEIVDWKLTELGVI